MSLLNEHLDTINTLRSELNYIDSILARRPALDNIKARHAKIEHAIETAAKADELSTKVEQLQNTLKEIQTLGPASAQGEWDAYDIIRRALPTSEQLI